MKETIHNHFKWQSRLRIYPYICGSSQTADHLDLSEALIGIHITLVLYVSGTLIVYPSLTVLKCFINKREGFLQLVHIEIPVVSHCIYYIF